MRIDPETIAKPFWGRSVEDTFLPLETSPSGISGEEAETRLKDFGPNAVAEGKRTTPFKIVFRQLGNPLIIVLMAAGIITVFLREWINAGVIWASILANTALGFWQENKAEEVFELLKEYIRTQARVRRNGKERIVEASGLVPGDVVRVTQGDRVPADGRIFFANNLEIDESVLTGESLPEKKSPEAVPVETPVADRSSMAWSGTLVVGGFGDMVVTATGAGTEFGKIAESITKQEQSRTPLQEAIRRFAGWTGIVIGILTTVLFGAGVYLGNDLVEMFLIAVSVAVSAVPEGLPVALTVILAVGAQRIAVHKGVVRKLLAAETLGSTSVILTDKTGTLTQAKMELERVIPGKEGNEKRLLGIALRNTDVVVENPDEPWETWRSFGRALEVALVRGAAKRGVLLPETGTTMLGKLPFDSGRKYSEVILQEENRVLRTFLGAPDILLKHVSLPAAEREQLEKILKETASEGKRVLGAASKPLHGNHRSILQDPERDMDSLTWEGFLVFHDPLRPHIAETIREARRAGIQTVILTGDHEETARAIALQTGIIDQKEGSAVVRGEELAAMTPEMLQRLPDKTKVYARVTPDQKVLIGKLYRDRKEVVAMIGDGVNDAPALQAADIGVAVGSGTDVAKSAADLVILDDDFRTLTTAIREGRRIIENIRKVIVYLFSSIFDELILIGGSLLLGFPLPLNALQILFVNFVGDSFPAVALAFERGIDPVNHHPPKIHKRLFDREMRFLIFIVGGISSLMLFGAYWYLPILGTPLELTKSFVFASFSTYSLFLIFSVRSLRKSIIRYNPFSNLPLAGGVCIGILLTGLVLYWPPLSHVFGVSFLPLPWLLAAVGFGFINILGMEFGKWLYGKKT